MRALLAVFALVLATCSVAPRTPSDVVAAYFADLGHDPIRTLSLTTEAFHRAHGLSVVTTAAAQAWQAGAASEPVLTPERVDRSQVAWLAIQTRVEFERIARSLITTPGEVSEQGDLASVAVTIAPAKGPPFVQRFQLMREDPAAEWHIDAVEQSGVERGNAFAAFVAHPTESARRALEQTVRR
jgi:hypothetical protein